VARQCVCYMLIVMKRYREKLPLSGRYTSCKQWLDNMLNAKYDEEIQREAANICISCFL